MFTYFHSNQQQSKVTAAGSFYKGGEKPVDLGARFREFFKPAAHASQMKVQHTGAARGDAEYRWGL